MHYRAPPPTRRAGRGTPARRRPTAPHFEVAYDRPNDRNAYAAAETENAAVNGIALTAHGDTYNDVLTALHAAGFMHASMVGSGGIDVISVPLTGSAADEPELLIGEDLEMAPSAN